MYTRKESILLNIFMKRLLVKPYYDYSGDVHTPQVIGVDEDEGELRMDICFNAIINLQGSQEDLCHLAKAYGINRIVQVYVFFSAQALISENHDYVMYRDLTTKGELKVIDY